MHPSLWRERSSVFAVKALGIFPGEAPGLQGRDDLVTQDFQPPAHRRVINLSEVLGILNEAARFNLINIDPA